MNLLSSDLDNKAIEAFSKSQKNLAIFRQLGIGRNTQDIERFIKTTIRGKQDQQDGN